MQRDGKNPKLPPSDLRSSNVCLCGCTKGLHGKHGDHCTMYLDGHGCECRRFVPQTA